MFLLPKRTHVTATNIITNSRIMSTLLDDNDDKFVFFYKFVKKICRFSNHYPQSFRIQSYVFYLFLDLSEQRIK